MPCVMQVKMRCTHTAVSIFRPVPSVFQAMVTAMKSKYLNCYMVIMHLDNITSFHAFSLMLIRPLIVYKNVTTWFVGIYTLIQWHEGDKRKVKNL